MTYLTRSWHTYSPRPVIVLVAHFVCQFLDLVGIQSGGVVKYDVVGWGDCSLSYML